MRPRAIASLSTLVQAELFDHIAEGISLIYEHVTEMSRAGQTLIEARRWRGNEAIQMVADEEAAKVLILLDVVRCRRDQGRRAEQLRRFNSHLAKGIYARSASMRPASYGELVEYVDLLRRSHYLDGPNDVDWIFRNEIEADREERLYVDYVESDGHRGWQTPQSRDVVSEFSPSGIYSPVVSLVNSLYKAGALARQSLDIIFTQWSDFEPDESSEWGSLSDRVDATLQALYEAELMSGDFQQLDEWTIKDSWTFPLHGAAMSRYPIDIETLRREQENYRGD